jgi:hypothetical protein
MLLCININGIDVHISFIVTLYYNKLFIINVVIA